VWHLTVRTLKGGDMNIRKRYVFESGCNCIICVQPLAMYRTLLHENVDVAQSRPITYVHSRCYFVMSIYL
jgi:hypothetical protein